MTKTNAVDFRKIVNRFLKEHGDVTEWPGRDLDWLDLLACMSYVAGYKAASEDAVRSVAKATNTQQGGAK